MRELIRHILIQENRKPIKDRVIGILEDIGFVDTIKSVGGYENFRKIVGDDFLNKEIKIEIIADIAYQTVSNHNLDLYDYDIDVMINEDMFSDGSSEVTYVHQVNEASEFYFKTYTFDEDGWMNDEPIDEGYSQLSRLPENKIDEILNGLVNVLL
jgi:hypothetical protein